MICLSPSTLVQGKPSEQEGKTLGTSGFKLRPTNSIEFTARTTNMSSKSWWQGWHKRFSDLTRHRIMISYCWPRGARISCGTYARGGIQGSQSGTETLGENWKSTGMGIESAHGWDVGRVKKKKWKAYGLGRHGRRLSWGGTSRRPAISLPYRVGRWSKTIRSNETCWVWADASEVVSQAHRV
jgi:hypothetical protein